MQKPPFSFFLGCSGFGKFGDSVLKESGTFATSLFEERKSKFSPYSALQNSSYWIPNGSLMASRDKTQYLQLELSKAVVIEMVSVHFW